MQRHEYNKFDQSHGTKRQLLLRLRSNIEYVFPRITGHFLVILLSNSSHQGGWLLKRLITHRYFIHVRWEGHLFPCHQDTRVSRLNVPGSRCTARRKGQGNGAFVRSCGRIYWGDAHPAVECNHHGIRVHLPQDAEACLIVRRMVREESKNEGGNCDGGYLKIENNQQSSHNGGARSRIPVNAPVSMVRLTNFVMKTFGSFLVLVSRRESCVKNVSQLVVGFQLRWSPT